MKLSAPLSIFIMEWLGQEKTISIPVTPANGIWFSWRVDATPAMQRLVRIRKMQPAAKRINRHLKRVAMRLLWIVAATLSFGMACEILTEFIR